MQWRGPIMGVIGFVLFIVGIVCVALTGQSPALFWVGIGFIIFAVVHFCVACGVCFSNLNGDVTTHNHYYAGTPGGQEITAQVDTRLLPSKTPISSTRTSKMELW
jgi:hypothetical protein